MRIKVADAFKMIQLLRARIEAERQAYKFGTEAMPGVCLSNQERYFVAFGAYLACFDQAKEADLKVEFIIDED